MAKLSRDQAYYIEKQLQDLEKVLTDKYLEEIIPPEPQKTLLKEKEKYAKKLKEIDLLLNGWIGSEYKREKECRNRAREVIQPMREKILFCDSSDILEQLNKFRNSILNKKDK